MSVIAVFSALNTNLVRPSAYKIDHLVCVLHHRVTVILLIGSSLLVTSRQYIGDPIACMATATNVHISMIEQYCWITTTFTLPKAWHKRIGHEIPHPGIDQARPGDERVYHQYYQWVCFVLFLQAVIFYVPHYLWKYWESGRIRMLTQNLYSPLVPRKEVEETTELLAEYFVANLHNNRFYFSRFVVIEALNFANIVGQIYFTDYFLGGEFNDYGLSVVRHSMRNATEEISPMVKVFPRVSKCTFHWYGSSGDIQRSDALCILPINIINEKIYLVLWFWFIALAALSGLCVIWRCITIISPHIRFLLLRANTKHVSLASTELICSKCLPSDWFVLMQLSKNIECLAFVQLIKNISHRLGRKYPEEVA